MHDARCTAAHPRMVLVGQRMSHDNTSIGIMNYIRLHVVIENIRIEQNDTTKRQEASDEIVNNVMINRNPRETENMAKRVKRETTQKRLGENCEVEQGRKKGQEKLKESPFAELKFRGMEDPETPHQSTIVTV